MISLEKMKFKTAIMDPEITAIFCTRGGYGCAKIIENISKINQNNTKITNKLLIGFSDITTLHLNFETNPKITSIHAPNLATNQFLRNDKFGKSNRESLYKVLFKGKSANFNNLELINCLSSQKEEELPQNAKLTGGCLSLLVTSLGTNHEVITDGKIIMIEEVTEPTYKIDRMLTHMKNAGKFNEPIAVIFGDLLNCDSPNVKVKDILIDFFKDYKFPVYIGANFGHSEINHSWIYNKNLKNQ